MLNKSVLIYSFACMIDFVGVAWAWSTLSEVLAYLNGSRFPLGQRGSDNRSWTVPELVIQLLCLLSVRSLYFAIVMEGTAGKVVHVDPYGASPVRGVVSSIALQV